MTAVRETFAWKKPEGCHKCRPALNYYLLCAWPGEYIDDSRSRFVNERVHAPNIQKRRHLFRDPADVGRTDHARRTTRHRLRGGEVQHSDREGDGRVSASICWV